MRPKWWLIGVGVALVAFFPLGWYVILTYAYQPEPPWLGALYYATNAAPVLGVGLVVAGFLLRRRR